MVTDPRGSDLAPHDLRVTHEPEVRNYFLRMIGHVTDPFMG